MDEHGRIDPANAREAISEQFPDVHPVAVTYLGEGYDSTAFDVDTCWVFRFPKRDDVETQLLLETRVLPVLARESPLPVPAFRYLGRPSRLFPRHFGGYAKLVGEPAVHVEAADVPVDAWAPRFAAFLSWLHSRPTADAARLGVEPLDMAAHIDEARAEALADLDRVERVAYDAPTDAWRACLGNAADLQGPWGPPVLLHGDLAAEHVLYDPETFVLTGVIDWSEMAIGDPAVDLAALFHWGAPAFASAVLAAYRRPVDEATLRRARFLAACRGAADVVFGLETGRPGYVGVGLNALATCAQPPGGHR